MATKIQFRRDTAANWTTNNPTLSQGELALDLTNNYFKIGDGSTAWNTLAYSRPTTIYETKVAVAASAIDLTLGNYFTKTISGATTFTVSNVPTSGTVGEFILDLTNGGSATVTWWAGIKWASGTAPTLTASGRDSLGFYTYDGGTIWTGVVIGKDLK